MAWRAAILVCLPVLLLGFVAVPLGLLFGTYQWRCFGIAIGLTVPAGLLTLLGTHWLSKTSPYGRVTALALGTFVRLLVGVGGGIVVFFGARETFQVDPVSYWLWLLGAYLTTLIVELVLLIGK